MAHVNLEDLRGFMSEGAEVAIQDLQNEDSAPFLKKNIRKVELCPDGTHVRFYFDQKTFFAVPLKSEVTETEREWCAEDAENGLKYVIRKG